jgi:hypothetical protein
LGIGSVSDVSGTADTGGASATGVPGDIFTLRSSSGFDVVGADPTRIPDFLAGAANTMSAGPDKVARVLVGPGPPGRRTVEMARQEITVP